MTTHNPFSYFFLKPGVVSHNAMLQAISFNSLTLFFVPFALLRVKKAMVIIYNINKFVTSRGERGTGS